MLLHLYCVFFQEPLDWVTLVCTYTYQHSRFAVTHSGHVNTHTHTHTHTLQPCNLNSPISLPAQSVLFSSILRWAFSRHKCVKGFEGFKETPLGHRHKTEEGGIISLYISSVGSKSKLSNHVFYQFMPFFISMSNLVVYISYFPQFPSLPLRFLWPFIYSATCKLDKTSD